MNDTVTDVEKRESKGGHHYVIDRDRNFRIARGIQKRSTEAIECHEPFIGHAPCQVCKRNVTGVIDKIDDFRLVSSPGIYSDFVDPICFRIEFTGLCRSLDQTLCVLSPCCEAELAQPEQPRDGRSQMRDSS